jgi:hypothetical protein
MTYGDRATTIDQVKTSAAVLRAMVEKATRKVEVQQKTLPPNNGNRLFLRGMDLPCQVDNVAARTLGKS